MLPSASVRHFNLGALAACRTWGVDSENRPQPGQLVPDLQAHSPAMRQKDGAEWTAAIGSQPTLPKSDRLLALRQAQGRAEVRDDAAGHPGRPNPSTRASNCARWCPRKWRSFATRASGRNPTTTNTWRGCRLHCALPISSGRASRCTHATTRPSHPGSCAVTRSGCPWRPPGKDTALTERACPLNLSALAMVAAPGHAGPTWSQVARSSPT